jgi:hypothetical protein
MPTTVYDASLVTKRKRTIAEYTFYKQLNYAVTFNGNVRREQPDTQLQTVYLYRKEAAAATNPTANLANVPPCACTTFVETNPGGDVSNNVQ